MDKKKHALDEDLAGRCIVCGVDEEDRTRGLCGTDYSRFLSARKRIPADKIAEWEDGLIKNGRLLPSRQGQRLVDEEDVFSIAANMFLAKHSPEQLSPGEQDAVEAYNRAKKRDSAATPKEKTRSNKPGKKANN